MTETDAPEDLRAVSITVTNDTDFDVVANRLLAYGLQNMERLYVIAVITGQIPSRELDGLRRVPGVADVEVQRPTGII